MLTASLTLIRPGSTSPEILWARRRPDRQFLGGFHAFFAGTVEPRDRRLAGGVDRPEATDDHLRAAALRETFEESGLLVTEDGLEHYDRDRRTDEVVSDATGTLKLDRLEPFGWWQAPDWAGLEFTTIFYGLRLTEQEGEQFDDVADTLDPDEFSYGRWIEADEALEKWSDGDVFLTKPLKSIVAALAGSDPEPDGLPSPDLLGPTRTDPGTGTYSEIYGGLIMLPLETPTLPPATHTNCVIAGRDQFVVIDPGPSDPEALAPLTDHLHKRRVAGDECLGVVLTHHHGDHVGGAALLAERFDLPVWARPETLYRVTDLEDVDRVVLEDDHTIDIDHPGPLRALHTPGHAPDHVVLYQPATDLVVGGDLVAGRGTIIIDPPEGHMGDYLESLRRVRRLGPRALLPAHGQLITRPVEVLNEYLEHRQMREDNILTALRDHGPATASQLVPDAYPDAPESVWPLAERSLLAHLIHLEEQGLATREGDRFSPTSN